MRDGSWSSSRECRSSCTRARCKGTLKAQNTVRLEVVKDKRNASGVGWCTVRDGIVHHGGAGRAQGGYREGLQL